jgi:hypothetical protein
VKVYVSTKHGLLRFQGSEIIVGDKQKPHRSKHPTRLCLGHIGVIPQAHTPDMIPWVRS